MPETLLVISDPTAYYLKHLDRLPPETHVIASNDPARLREAAAEAGVLLNAEFREPALLLSTFPHARKLKWVHSVSAGVEHILSPEIVASPVPLTNGRGVFKRPLGEWAVAAMLHFAYDLRRMQRSQERGEWDVFDTNELYGKTLGIVGYGEIGRATAERARPFGMRILAMRRRPELSAADPLVDRTYPPAELRAMIAECDYIVAAAPITVETRGLIGARENCHDETDGGDHQHRPRSGDRREAADRRAGLEAHPRRRSGRVRGRTAAQRATLFTSSRTYSCPRTPPITRPVGATTRFNVSSIISSASVKASRSRIWWTKMPATKEEEVRSQKSEDRSPKAEVTFADIQRAADSIKPIAKRTPANDVAQLRRRLGRRRVLQVRESPDRRRVQNPRRVELRFLDSKRQAAERRGRVFVGNHAQAVAIAAQYVGIPATIVMPNDAPKAKMEATRARGARIVTIDRVKDDREAIGRGIADETGASLIPPYDHPWTMAGQGTIALELLADVSDLDALVVPVGGGGLISGCAIAAKHLKPSIRIFGAEPEMANDTFLSMAAGKRVRIGPPQTIADGLMSMSPGELTFPIIQKHVEQILTGQRGRDSRGSESSYCCA
jgi:threonine dehydratase